MSKFQLKLTTDNIVNCIIYVAIGLLLAILKAGSLNILMTVVGALLIVMGVIDIVKSKDLTKGLIEIGIGAVIILCGWLIADVVLLIFGILLIIKGIVEIVENHGAGFPILVSPIITVVIGALLVIAKWALIDVICVIAGIVFIVNGILCLFGKTLYKK